MTVVQRIGRLAALAALLVAGGAVAGPALAAQGAVSIVDKTFDPAQIVVAQGDSVTWTVTKSIGEPHSVTSGKPGESDAGKAFDSGIKLKDNGQSFQFTFATAGTFSYFCTVHTEMRGTVVVLAPGQTLPPAGPPAAENGGTIDKRVIAGGILIATLVILFGAAWLYRRANPA